MAEAELAPFIAEVDRPALVRLGYRLLGSVEEAEDVVQDAHVKLLAADPRPDHPGAWLFRTVTNLAIDRLRHLQVQRRAYSGPWLPEPLDTSDTGAEGAAQREEDLSVGLLLLLERLSAGERVAFVLRESFDFDFATMGQVLGVRADACRQRYHRARRKLDGERPAPVPSAAQKRLLERLRDAVLAGDRAGVVSLLSDDALLLTDGGGKVSAAVRPVAAPARIAQVLLHLAAQQPRAELTFEWRPLNGGVGLLVRQNGGPYAVIQAGLAGTGRLNRLYVVRNPDKLARL